MLAETLRTVETHPPFATRPHLVACLEDALLARAGCLSVDATHRQLRVACLDTLLLDGTDAPRACERLAKTLRPYRMRTRRRTWSWRGCFPCTLARRPPADTMDHPPSSSASTAPRK